jgi:hypothetical protein
LTARGQPFAAQLADADRSCNACATKKRKAPGFHALRIQAWKKADTGWDVSEISK